MSLLEKCLINDPQDASKNAEKICMVLMPNPDQTDCITSSKYIEPTKGHSSLLGDGSVIFFQTLTFSYAYIRGNKDDKFSL